MTSRSFILQLKSQMQTYTCRDNMALKTSDSLTMNPTYVVSTGDRIESGKPLSWDVWTSRQPHVGKEDDEPISSPGRFHKEEFEVCSQ